MDIVLGVSIAPTSVQMVMLQGETADGAMIDESEFPVAAVDDSPTVSASDRVIAAILCTREDAAGAGLELDSIGVAYADKLDAAVLRDALATYKIENVLLVSAFLAATALTQSVGGAMGYERTAVLFVEPDTATLALVETSDGSVDDVYTERWDTESAQMITAELVELVAGLDELPTPPGGLFVVGSGVDIAPIRRRLQEATSLIVNVPEEPETALARGAALASANTLASSTAALAYAADPGTGAVDVSALPEYLSATHAELGEDDLAYSAVADDEANAPTVVMDGSGDSEPRPRPALLVGSAVAIAAFSGVLALEIALSLGIRTTVGSLPAPIQSIIAPVQQALLPAPEVAAMKMVAPKPLSPPSVAPPAVAPAPAPAVPPAVLPAAPAPAAPIPPAPAVPVPVFAPPIAPAPVPPVHLPDLPVSPPVVEAPPHSTPPIYVPPPKSPPHRPPPGQEPPPNPGSDGPVNGPGPGRGNPGSGGPHGGGPPVGSVPGHGAPGGGLPQGGGATPGAGVPPGGGPTGGGEPPSGGGPVGGGESHGGGAPTGSGESPSGGGPAGGSSSSSGGSSSTGGEVGGGGSSSSSSSGSEAGGSSGSSSSSSSGSEK